MVICPKCGKENTSYRKVKEGLYRYIQCGCPVSTMKQIAIEAGMYPEIACDIHEKEYP